jgi:hypothetical protein
MAGLPTTNPRVQDVARLLHRHALRLKAHSEFRDIFLEGRHDVIAHELRILQDRLRRGAGLPLMAENVLHVPVHAVVIAANGTRCFRCREP